MFGWVLCIVILGARWKIIFKLLVLKLVKHGPYKQVEDRGLSQHDWLQESASLNLGLSDIESFREI